MTAVRKIAEGDVYGGWTVIEVVRGLAGRGGRYVVKCNRCGLQRMRRATNVAIAQGCKRCTKLDGERHDKATPALIERQRKLYDIPVALDLDAPFETDIDARATLLHFGGTLNQSQLAAAFGVSRQRVQQIEARAMKRLALALIKAGVSQEDIVEWLCRSRPETAMERSENAPEAEGGVGRMHGSQWTNPPAPAAPAECDPWSDHGLRVLRAIVVFGVEAELCEHARLVMLADEVMP